MTIIEDFKGNPVEIKIKNKVLTFDKLILIKNLINSYIWCVEGMAEESGNYKRIVEEFNNNIYICCFESALNLGHNSVYIFAKQYFKNYKNENEVK